MKCQGDACPSGEVEALLWRPHHIRKFAETFLKGWFDSMCGQFGYATLITAEMKSLWREKLQALGCLSFRCSSIAKKLHGNPMSMQQDTLNHNMNKSQESDKEAEAAGRC
ncbi:hypothetical protein PAMP_013905 [Pampus punctatissimus]